MLMPRFPFYVCLLLSTTCLNFILFLKILILLLLSFINFFFKFLHLGQFRYSLFY